MSKNLQTGAVNVDYVSTHTGQKASVEECKHIPLPTSLQKEVQEKFVAGITIERIMDGKWLYNDLHGSYMLQVLIDVRSQIGGRAACHQYEERVNRKHFVTRQDLCNITRAVHSYSHHRHSEDAISVIWMVVAGRSFLQVSGLKTH